MNFLNFPPLPLEFPPGAPRPDIFSAIAVIALAMGCCWVMMRGAEARCRGGVVVAKVTQYALMEGQWTSRVRQGFIHVIGESKSSWDEVVFNHDKVCKTKEESPKKYLTGGDSGAFRGSKVVSREGEGLKGFVAELQTNGTCSGIIWPYTAPCAIYQPIRIQPPACHRYQPYRPIVQLPDALVTPSW